MSHGKNTFLKALKLTALLLVSSFILSCATQSILPSADNTQSNPYADQALVALSQEDYLLAADLFTQAAELSQGSLRHQHLIASIHAYLQAAQTGSAKRLIDDLLQPSSGLSPEHTIQLAEILLSQGRPRYANQLLATLEGLPLNRQQRIEHHKLNSSAFLQAGNLVESVNERLKLDFLIVDSKDKLKNQVTVLETLSLLSQQALEFLRSSSNSNMIGWVELSMILKKQGILNPNSTDIKDWKVINPSHPANSELLSILANQARLNFKPAKRVGVFLPTEGPFASAAQSIKNGLISAAFELSSQWAMNIRFYDTSSSTIEALYNQAINDNISAIIGPLDKANTLAMASLNQLDIPVISLNKGRDDYLHNYYEFSLSPEDDITQVLSLAWLKGHENALVFSPQSAYGDRLAQHFSQQWAQLGGNVLATQTYPLKEADYSTSIKQLLNIDQSIDRFKRLRQRLNLSMQFEDRRRHDADFLFLIAAPREGRLIKPQLRFHRATQLAVYSTPKIYAGELNTIANRDLDGVLFCDMPWLIEPTNTAKEKPTDTLQLWSTSRGSHRRLTALGYDAYQLIPHLARMRTQELARLMGKTGILSMKANGHINRQLNCGQFKRGRINALGLAPHIETAINLPNTPTITPSYSSPSSTSPLNAR